MVEVKTLEITQEDLAEWFKLRANLKKIKAKEILMRKHIFNTLFPHPNEGVNEHELPDNYILKGTYKLDRKLDMGVFGSMTDVLREQQINPDKMVAVKHSLDLREYRKLTDVERELFDQCIVTKPGTPSLEITGGGED